MCDLQSEPQLPFRVGDVVSWCGVEGKIKEVELRTIDVSFPDYGRDIAFFLDGTYLNWHREPSLKLVSRPKKEPLRVEFEKVMCCGPVHGMIYDDRLDQFVGKRVRVIVEEA